MTFSNPASANEWTALRILRRQRRGTDAAGVTFLECVAGLSLQA
jgi:hypothetical protein